MKFGNRILAWWLSLVLLLAAMPFSVAAEEPPSLDLPFGETVNGTIGRYEAVTYRFVPTQGGVHLFRLEKEPYMGMSLSDSTGQFLCNKEGNGSVSVQAALTAGETYYLMLYAYSLSTEHAYRVTVTETVPPTSMHITRGDTWQTVYIDELDGTFLEVTFEPQNAAYEDVTWTSSDSEVAIIDDAFGEVMFLGTGTVVFTATSKSGFSDSIEVTVLSLAEAARPLADTETEIRTDSYEILSFIPDKSGKYRFSSSVIHDKADPKIVLYDADGVRLKSGDDVGDNEQFSMEYALKAGETYYLFLNTYVTDVMDDAFLLTVEYVTKVEAIHLSDGDIVGDIGEEYPLAVTFTPAGVEPETYTFFSAAPSVATVDENGILHLHRAGVTTVTVTCASGFTDSITVTVHPEHKYANACDTVCDKCGAMRGVTHDVDAAGTCRLCGKNLWYIYTVTDGEAILTASRKPLAGAITLPQTIDGYPVTAIGREMFAYGMEITGVTIPEGIAVIEPYAFSGCTALQEVNLPTTLTTLGEGAFRGCRELRSITLPNGVTAIGEYAFAVCESLAEITFGAQVAQVKNGAFFGCTALADVWYDGAANDREAVRIEDDNGPLTTARWHYNDVKTGDADGSGKIDSTDARMVLQYAVKKIDAAALDLAVADVDGNGKVDSTDARLILQYAVQKIEQFPAK